MPRQIIIILMSLLVITSFVSGCIATSQQEKPVISSVPTTISPTVEIQKNKYVVGDIIGKNPNEFISAFVVYDVIPETNQYQIDTVYTDSSNQWGYRNYPNPVITKMDYVEKAYPYRISHIDISNIVTKYSSQDAMDNSLSKTIEPTISHSTSSYYDYNSDTSSGSSSSSGKCWVNGYYRKSGVYVNGYYRSC